MRTVENLIRELRKFPLDARCYAYEGSVVAVVVVGAERVTRPGGGAGRPFLGEIPCGESDDVGETVTSVTHTGFFRAEKDGKVTYSLDGTTWSSDLPSVARPGDSP